MNDMRLLECLQIRLPSRDYTRYALREDVFKKIQINDNSCIENKKK